MSSRRSRGSADIETTLGGPVLLFDLDGTLTDPRIGIVRCMKYALDQLGGACPADDVLAAFIGPPMRRTFGTLLKTDDTRVIEDAMRLFRSRYGDTGLFENEVYAGVPEMLVQCRRMASATFVATAKVKEYAERIVHYFGLRQHFQAVYGADMAGRLDDKRHLVAHLLSTERVAACGTVMIGDRSNDVVAAKANGLRSVGVLWGYGSEDELRDAGADVICAAPSELAGCIAKLTG